MIAVEGANNMTGSRPIITLPPRPGYRPPPRDADNGDYGMGAQ
jgi:hypothetical protein